MIYKRVSDLPVEIAQSLPTGADYIYLREYRLAWDNIAEDTDELRRHETAHRVAWSAVRRKYELDDKGKWYKSEIKGWLFDR